MNNEKDFNAVIAEIKNRSVFNRNQQIKTTFNVAQLIPFYIDEVLPGDTMDITTNYVMRLSTLIAPVMDNLYIDIFYFYVPMRIIWKNWREFLGENRKSKWTSNIKYSIPTIKVDKDGFTEKSIGDYMGIPTKIGPMEVNALPFRAYAKIYNEWFRDENLQDPVLDYYEINGTTNTTAPGGVLWATAYGTAPPLRANKYYDYFTSCLPNPQKGEEVLLNVLEGNLELPVYTTDKEVPYNIHKQYALEFKKHNNEPFTKTGNYLAYWKKSDQTKAGLTEDNKQGPIPHNQISSIIRPSNLWANMKNEDMKAITINELRLAIKTQQILEAEARVGTRYAEILKAHFGVNIDSGRIQRPEFLHSTHELFSMSQIIQSSSTTPTSPQGHAAAYGQTATKPTTNNRFIKSFKEHGYIIGIVVIRKKETYDKGLEKLWMRKDKLDFYFPELDNIGEQPVFKDEIYYKQEHTTIKDGEKIKEIFGYNEAWAEYKYKPNKVTGDMRNNSSKTLNYWHFGENLSDAPTLTNSFIQADHTAVDRVLAVNSSQADQVIADIYVQNKTTRLISLNSIPDKIV